MLKINIKDVNKIIELQKELITYNDFIFAAERVWGAKLTLKKIISNVFGMFESRELKLDTKTKNKILEILKEKRTEIENKILSEVKTKCN